MRTSIITDGGRVSIGVEHPTELLCGFLARGAFSEWLTERVASHKAGHDKIVLCLIIKYFDADGLHWVELLDVHLWFHRWVPGLCPVKACTVGTVLYRLLHLGSHLMPEVAYGKTLQGPAYTLMAYVGSVD